MLLAEAILLSVEKNPNRCEQKVLQVLVPEYPAWCKYQDREWGRHFYRRDSNDAQNSTTAYKANQFNSIVGIRNDSLPGIPWLDFPVSFDRYAIRI
jgi:hypothetical protein